MTVVTTSLVVVLRPPPPTTSLYTLYSLEDTVQSTTRVSWATLPHHRRAAGGGRKTRQNSQNSHGQRHLAVEICPGRTDRDVILEKNMLELGRCQIKINNIFSVILECVTRFAGQLLAFLCSYCPFLPYSRFINNISKFEPNPKNPPPPKKKS